MLGAQSHNSQLCFKGLQAYNRAIQEMGRALASPQRAVGDGLIVAGRVMQLYEVCAYTPFYINCYVTGELQELIIFMWRVTALLWLC